MLTWYEYIRWCSSSLIHLLIMLFCYELQKIYSAKFYLKNFFSNFSYLNKKLKSLWNFNIAQNTTNNQGWANKMNHLPLSTKSNSIVHFQLTLKFPKHIYMRFTLSLIFTKSSKTIQLSHSAVIWKYYFTWLCPYYLIHYFYYYYCCSMIHFHRHYQHLCQ